MNSHSPRIELGKVKHLRIKQGIAALGLAATVLVGTAAVAGAADGGGTGSGPAASTTQGARRHPGVHLRHVGFTAAAQVLGQDPKALLQSMVENGQTLAQVAGDQTDAVIAAAVAAIRSEVGAAHDSGKLTDDQYARLTERMDAHLQDRVTQLVQTWVPKPRPQA